MSDAEWPRRPQVLLVVNEYVLNAGQHEDSMALLKEAAYDGAGGLGQLLGLACSDPVSPSSP